jgi:L-2-hydroxyglutarate oxidase
MEPCDLAVVGGGIVGLATAYQLLGLRPDLRLVVLEKEPEIARHQSSHNTGVIHAGIYYRPGSLKARLCREGKAELEAFAAEHGIPFSRCGKLIVALDASELGRLRELGEKGRANGVEGLEEIGPERIREIEPHIAGIRALHSPGTGSIDFGVVSHAIAAEIQARGGKILTGHEVVGIEERGTELRLSFRAGSGAAIPPPGRGHRHDAITVRFAITCAGLHSDRVAAMTGGARDPRIVPFRGDYYTFKPEARHLIRAHVNPVPDPAFPFLGVHFSRTIDGDVRAGPNAVLAFAREGYSLATISPADLLETLAFPGFRRLLVKYLRTGLREMWRDLSKPAFVAALRRYLPELRAEDLVFGPSGVRAQSLGADGQLLDDFAFSRAHRVLHVRNAPSPAATASLAIGRHLAAMARTEFGL